MTIANKILVLALAIIIVFFVVNLSQNRTSQTVTMDNSVQNTTITPNKDKFSPQENEGGNVTVTAQPEVLGIGQKPRFKLEFNTHSVDLSFDIANQSYLIDDRGNRVEGSTWNGSPPGGHHREGTLIFNDPLSETKYAEFIIKEIAGVSERKFKWEL
ncbi:hypothetical protein A3F57_03570 [Candidatus Roizmanbacteria bacterium RIFCSPHIGHO2_12_FULL_36_11]|nr:MAG: hypothetical protein A3F57_03570 [Candidatus Roizmanbacteria bacterium RIFCSPHIGHO2_12_FULL_36_11]